MREFPFDCGHARHGAPIAPWPDLCPGCQLDAEGACKSELWATVRTLAVFLVIAFALAGACTGGS